MRRKLVVGDRVVCIDKYRKSLTGKHGIVIDREERGHGLGFSTLRVKFDNGIIIRDAVSYFVLEKTPCSNCVYNDPQLGCVAYEYDADCSTGRRDD